LKEYLFLTESGLEGRRLVKIQCFFPFKWFVKRTEELTQACEFSYRKELGGWQNNPVSIQVTKTYLQAECRK